MTAFLQNCLNGISIGSIYALIAIGYTMVYGILRLINFAHGDIFMMAGYFMIICMTDLLIPWTYRCCSSCCSQCCSAYSSSALPISRFAMRRVCPL